MYERFYCKCGAEIDRITNYDNNGLCDVCAEADFLRDNPEDEDVA